MHLHDSSVVNEAMTPCQSGANSLADSDSAQQAEEKAVDACGASEKCASGARPRCSSAPLLNAAPSRPAYSPKEAPMISASLPPLPLAVTTVSPSLSSSILQTQYSPASESFTSAHSVRTGRTSPATYARPKETHSQPISSLRRTPSDARLARKASLDANNTLAAASG